MTTNQEFEAAVGELQAALDRAAALNIQAAAAEQQRKYEEHLNALRQDRK